MSIVRYAIEQVRDEAIISDMRREQEARDYLRDAAADLPTDVLIERASREGCFVPAMDGWLVGRPDLAIRAPEDAVQDTIRQTLLRRAASATDEKSDPSLLPLLKAYHPTQPEQKQALLEGLYVMATTAPERSKSYLAHLFANVGTAAGNDAESDQLKLLTERLRDKRQRETVELLAAPLGHTVFESPGLINRVRTQTPKLHLERTLPAVAVAAAVISNMPTPAHANEQPQPAVVVSSWSTDEKPSTVPDSRQDETEPAADFTQQDSNDSPKVTAEQDEVEPAKVSVSLESVVIAVQPRTFTPETPDDRPVLEPQVMTAPSIKTPSSDKDNAIIITKSKTEPAPAAPAEEVTPDTVTEPTAGQPDAESKQAAPRDTMPAPKSDNETADSSPTSPVSNEEKTTSVSVPESVDTLATQQQLAKQFIITLQTARQAKSLSVLRGGAPDPTDPADKMTDDFVFLTQLLEDNMNKLIDGDDELTSETLAAWQRMIDPNNISLYGPEQQANILSIEASAQALDAQGKTAEANRLRAISAYNVEVIEVVNDPNMINQFVSPDPDEQPAPDAKGEQSDNLTEYRLTEDQLRVTDKVAADRGWKDWQKDMFIDLVEQAVQNAEKYHINPANLVAQAVIESGNFMSSLTRNYNNAFGIKDGSDTKSTPPLPTSEYINGKYVKIQDRFAAFDSIGEGAAYYASHLLQKSWYADARRFYRSPELSMLGLENELDKNGNITRHRYMAYATSATYEKTIATMRNQLRLDELMPNRYFLSSEAAKKLVGAATDSKPNHSRGSTYPDKFHGQYYYSQHDPRWGDKIYENPGASTRHTNSTSACLPSSEAIIATNFGDKVTPEETAEWNIEHGFRIPNRGTADASWFAFAKKYDYRIRPVSLNGESFREALKNGAMIAVSAHEPALNMNTPATTGGHWFVVSKIADNGRFNILDPNNAVLSSRTFTIDGLSDGGLRVAYALFKD